MKAIEQEPRSIRAAAEGAEALEDELRQRTLLQSLMQITPAVAHDLRAPINAMVFNLEILRETIASGKGVEPGGRERQLRYVNVLKEELQRLHRELEIFIAHISPRGDRTETLDLRELLEELAVLLTGPARKQQVQIRRFLPDSAVSVEVNRFLLRQGMLHLGLAALAGVSKDGTLEIRLERRDERALIHVGGDALGAEPLGFDSSPSSVARGILTALGGEARLSEGHSGYEVELMIADTKG